MYKFCLLACLLLSIVFTQAQSKNPKTIFEAFNVANTACAMNSESDEPAPLEELIESGLAMNSSANTNALREAKDKIAAHTRNTNYTTTGAPLYFFLSGGSLVQQGNVYTLYSKSGKVLFKKAFQVTDKMYYDNGGFNAYTDGPLTTYYDESGKVISAKKYNFVQYAGNGFFEVRKDTKWGIIDGKGTVILPVLYDDASAFLMGGKVYFDVRQDGKTFFLAPDKKTKIFIPHNEQPQLIKNRYWYMSGKVYDPVTSKRLFCKIGETIQRVGTTDWLTVDGWDGKKLYFDIDGNLMKADIGELDQITPAIYMAKRKDYELHGLMNNKLQWITKPVYSSLSTGKEGKYYIYHTSASSATAGLLDSKAQVIVKEGIYHDFTTSDKDNWVLGVGNDHSDLINVVTHKIIPLKKNFSELGRIGKNNFIIAAGIDRKYIDKEYYILDSNYTIQEFPAFKWVNYDENMNLFSAGVTDDSRIYFTKDLRIKEFIIDGKKYQHFASISLLSSHRFYVRLPDGRNFVQVGDQQFIPTDCINVEYDSIQRWYIGELPTTYQYGSFDSTGATIIPFTCMRITRFSPLSQTTTVQLADEYEQLIDKAGNILFDMKYDVVKPFYNYFIVAKGSYHGVIDRNGKEIIPSRYSNIFVRDGQIIGRHGYKDQEQVYDIQLLFSK